MDDRRRCIMLIFLHHLILLFVVSVCFAERPTVTVTVRASSETLRKIASSVAFDRLAFTERFTLQLADALALLGLELRLQDLLSTEDVVLAKMRGGVEGGKEQGTLEVEILRLDVEKVQQERNYVENNISGNFILVGGVYKQVQTGVRYRYDFKEDRYVPDKDGLYVRALDGNYHMASTFYSYAPHVDEYYTVNFEVAYTLRTSLVSKNGRKSFKEWLYTRKHYYDPYNNRLLSTEHSPDNLIWLLGSRLASFIAAELSSTYRTVGEVESTKFPRVLLNIGRRDGVREGLHYTVVRDGRTIAELVVRRASEDYSECEVTYLAYGETVKPADGVIESSPGLVFPIRLGVTLGNGELLRFHFGVKQLNIHREEIASADFSIGYRWDEFYQALINGNIQEAPIKELSGGLRLRVFRISEFSALHAALLFTAINPENAWLKVGFYLNVGPLEGFVFYVPFTSDTQFLFGGGLAW